MKKTILLLIISLIFILPQSIMASHYMGGEITWECISSGSNAGKHVFYIKLYRECGGIAFGSSLNLVSTSPAGTIPMTLVSGYPVDISPDCNYAYTPITCAGAEYSGADNTGAMSEYLYKSAPIILNGIPPTSGWTFSVSSYYRNPSNNITNLQSWSIKAKMYPLNNTNTSVCYDNSPQFANTAKTVLTAAYPYSANHAVYDKDLDSLHFEWGQPSNVTGAALTYKTGYSYTNPIASPSINSNNTAATIDPQTGQVSFLSYTTGSFVTNIKISSYRDNQLISEIWREMQLIILPSNTNSPPTVSLNTNNSIVADTVFVGETIDFALTISDNGFLPNGTPQTIYMNANGQQFGNYIASSSSNPISTYDSQNGCPKIPCATLTPAPSETLPLTGLFGTQTQFNWATSINHLNILPDGSFGTKTYYFNFDIWDDYCPVPAQTNFTYSITILKDSLPTLSTEIKSINTFENGDLNIKWSLINDDNNSFLSYNLYEANDISGPYILLDSIINKNIGSYTYNSGQTPTMKYFKIKTHQNNNSDNSPLTVSKVFSNIVLQTTKIGNCITKLDWNKPTNSNELYKIKRKHNGVWTLIDSTNLLTYIDSSAFNNVKYMVETSNITIIDSLSNTFFTKSNSNIRNEKYSINIGPDTTISNNESLLLNITNSFDTYLWNSGSSNNWVLIQGANYLIGTNHIWLKASMSYGCEITDSLVLTIEDDTPLITEIKSINTLINGGIKINWSPIIDTNNSFISYNIYHANSINGPFTLLDSISNINISSFTYNTAQNPTIKYYKIETNQIRYNNTVGATSSTIFKNIVLNSTNIGMCITNLTWNNTIASNPYFKIMRKDNGVWTLIDSTTNTYYTDTCTFNNANYMIETPVVSYNDSIGNTTITYSNSNIKHEEYILNIGNDTTIYNNESLLLNISNIYDSYLWNNGSSNNWLYIQGADYTIGDNHIWLKASMNYGCEITDSLILTVENNTTLSTEIMSINTIQNGNIKINWSPIIDNNNSFISNNIYVANSLIGPYTLLDSISSININSFTYNTTQDPIINYYKIKTNQFSINNTIITTSSTILKNIVLNSTNMDKCITNLIWNNINETNPYFKIKRKDNGIWTLIDSTIYTNYTDTSAFNNSEYMIESPEVTYTNNIGNTIITSSNSNTKYAQTSFSIGADTTICDNASMLLNINNGFDSYLWYDGIINNWILIHGSHLTIGDNNIWLKASMDYGCEITDSLILTVEDCSSSIEENSDNIGLETYPNPNYGKFTLDINSLDTRNLLIDIISIDGKIIYSKNTKITSPKTSINIDISGNAAGSYIIRVSNDIYKKHKAIKLF